MNVTFNRWIYHLVRSWQSGIWTFQIDQKYFENFYDKIFEAIEKFQINLLCRSINQQTHKWTIILMIKSKQWPWSRDEFFDNKERKWIGSNDPNKPTIFWSVLMVPNDKPAHVNTYQTHNGHDNTSFLFSLNVSIYIMLPPIVVSLHGTKMWMIIMSY